MSRKRAVQLGLGFAVLVAAVAVAWAAGPGTRADAAPGARRTPGPVVAVAPGGLLSSVSAPGSLPADTPPPLREATGWPFDELPLVIKAMSFPTPRVAVPFNAPSLADDLFARALVEPTPRSGVASAAPGAVGQAPWLLLPPVAGIAVFALDDTGRRDGGGSDGGAPGTPPGGDGGEPVPPTVVPEPATWGLLLIGLLLLGGVGLRRARGGQRRSG